MRLEVFICERSRMLHQQYSTAFIYFTVCNGICICICICAIRNFCWRFSSFFGQHRACLSNSQKQISNGSKNAFQVCKCKCVCAQKWCMVFIDVTFVSASICCVHGVYFIPNLQEYSLRQEYYFEWHFSASNDVRFN